MQTLVQMVIYSFMVLFHYVSGTFVLSDVTESKMHAFHVSVCEMEYDQDRNALEMSYRVFLDDLEEGLKLWSGSRDVDVLAVDYKPTLDSLLAEYMLAQLKLIINEDTSEVTYLGSRVDAEVMKIYLEVSEIKKIKSLAIRNEVLMDLFSDQVNLVHFKSGSNKQSLKFDNRQRFASLDLTNQK